MEVLVFHSTKGIFSININLKKENYGDRQTDGQRSARYETLKTSYMNCYLGLEYQFLVFGYCRIHLDNIMSNSGQLFGMRPTVAAFHLHSDAHCAA